MKTMKYLSMLLMLLVFSIGMVSCSNDDNEPTGDYASEVAGIYTGKLSVNNTVIEDAYVVRVDKISSKVVRVNAEFYQDGYENYNVSYVNGQYVFESETSVNITISVIGKAMNLSYLSVGGNINTFRGTRD